MAEKVFDVVIIGSGPAGLTAGIYCGRANLKTVVIGGARWGGQLMLTTDVENFPGFPKGILGPTLMLNMREQCERFGVGVDEEDVTGVDFAAKPFKLRTAQKEYLGKAVIVATGAAARWLGVLGEEKLIGRGVSSCAPCDAPFFKDKAVIVVGGGDAAMEEALTLAKFASEVVIVHRKSEFKASKIMQKRALENEKIRVVWNTEVDEIIGEGKVSGVKLKSQIQNSKDQINFKSQIINSKGKIGSEANGKIEWEMPIDGVFVAIGHTPATGIFAGKLALDEKGYLTKAINPDSQILKGFRTMSSVEGVFVSGDVHDHTYRQAVTAAGYGCMAALEAIKWVEERR